MNISKDYLWSIYNSDLSEDRHHVKMAIKSCKSRNIPYYGILKIRYKHHFRSFACMYTRTSDIDKSFSRSVEGFINFISYLGEVPENMLNPTIGRIDHSVGYYVGNFKWQSKSDNSKESINRVGIKIPRTRTNLNKIYYNDGKKNYLKNREFVPPNNWVRGRLPGQVYYNDGERNYRKPIDFIPPDNLVLGRLPLNK